MEFKCYLQEPSIISYAEELSEEESFDLALLTKVQDHPYLYNSEKKNDKQVERAWKKISEELNTPGYTFSYAS